ncbi:hypothetical protein BC332_17146 [Capsicum chinense]|nr:hypothetical protein BC332_17146 [Capsicum chinense]
MCLSGVTLHDSLFGGANEQAPNEQDGGAIDQVGGVNEQNHDEDGLLGLQYILLLQVLNLIPRGIFDRVFNVEVSEDVNDYRVINGYTLVDVFCFQCETLLWWQFFAVPQPSPSIYIRQGRFYMRLHKLTYWDNEPLLRDLNEELGLPYELVPDEQVLGGNEQNADQDGNANERIPTEQDIGANEPNADQDGEFNEQVPNEQDVDVNEQNADLDGDNEQNHDQDEGGNDQNNDEDGSPQAKRRKM